MPARITFHLRKVVRLESRRLAVGARDMTESSPSQAASDLARLVSERREEARDAVIRGAAHRLRNSITALLGYVDVVRHADPQAPENLTIALDGIRRVCDTASRTSWALFDLSDLDRAQDESLGETVARIGRLLRDGSAAQLEVVEEIPDGAHELAGPPRDAAWLLLAAGTQLARRGDANASLALGVRLHEDGSPEMYVEASSVDEDQGDLESIVDLVGEVPGVREVRRDGDRRLGVLLATNRRRG